MPAAASPVLLSDPQVSAIDVRECGEPLVALGERFGPAAALVRRGLADRLARAADLLPAGIGLRVVEGHRSVADQRTIIAAYSGEVCAHHPGIGPAELERLTSRYVAPVAVAPHVAGAAVDLTLVGIGHPGGADLDLGTPVDATPEQSGGRCMTAAPDISPTARAHREVLGHAMTTAGLVNYPTEWWHWSFGDRYWALITGAPAAIYGPVDATSGKAGSRQAGSDEAA